MCSRLNTSLIKALTVYLGQQNPFRYMLQGLVVNEIGGSPIGDEKLSMIGWSYDDRWWYVP